MTMELQANLPSRFYVRHDVFMHYWWEVTFYEGSLYIQQSSACILPLAGGPEVGIKVTPTNVQWDAAYALLNSVKLNGIRGNKEILDGHQIGWDVLWEGVKSKRTIINPVGESIDKLFEAVALLTTCEEFPDGIVDADVF